MRAIFCCRKPDQEAEKTAAEKLLDAKQQQVQDLREFFRELCIYLLMLGCFSLSIWLDSSSLQKHNLASAFNKAIMPADTPTSIDSFFSTLYSRDNSTGGCSGMLCKITTTDYFASELNHSSRASDLYGSVMLGQIRLRQIRVQKRECASFYKQLEAIDCYPDFAAGEEETTFTKEWYPDFDTSVDTAFKWRSQADIGEVRDLQRLPPPKFSAPNTANPNTPTPTHQPRASSALPHHRPIRHLPRSDAVYRSKLKSLTFLVMGNYFIVLTFLSCVQPRALLSISPRMRASWPRALQSCTMRTG
jgi:hypothetical protein